MSEKITKQKPARNQQPKQDRREEYVRTLLDDFALCTDFGPLLLCDNTGNILCLLNNKAHLPYQKPALLLCKTIPALHYLLAGLKTAQTCLFLHTQWLSAILPEKYHCIGVEFACDMEFPDLDSILAFQKWQQAHTAVPLLVHGIGIVDAAYKTCRLNLDLTLSHASKPDYAKVFTYRFFEPLIIAIQSYNDVVNEWYKAGFTVIPANFVDCLAGLSRYFSTQNIPEFDM